MRRRVVFGVAASAALTLAATTARAQGQGLELELFADRLEIHDLAPLGSVAILSAERTPVGFTSRVDTRVRSAVDTDGDGLAVLDLEEPAAEASVWLAVELGTGHLGTLSPTEGWPRSFDSPLGLATDPQSGAQVVAIDGHARLHLLLVRRQVGIWHAVAADGGLAEGTGIADGRTMLLEPGWETTVGTAAAPGEYEPSDLFFALDPGTLAIDGQIYGGMNALP